MTISPPTDLHASIAAIFGTHKGALADAARALPVDYRTLRRYLAGQRPTPAWVRERLALLQALSMVAPPAGSIAEEDRDAECGAALEPHLDELARRAVAAGWHPAEVCAAVLTWAVHRTIDGAGVTGAREMLAEAAAICDAEDVGTDE